MTFRDFLTGCWLACVVIVMAGVSFLHATGKLQWVPVSIMIGLAVCVPLAGFAVGLIIDWRLRREGN